MAVVFQANGLIVTDQQLSAGTGGFSTFLRLNNNGQGNDDGEGEGEGEGGGEGSSGVEQGFNTAANSETLSSGQNSDMVASFTNSLALSAIPIVKINGVDYLQFGLDVNQAQRLLTLTDLKLYQATTGNVSSQTALGAPRFDMDTGGNVSVPLPETGHGSGSSDYAFYIPLSSIDPSKGFVYLFARFINADGGFEEFGLGSPAHPSFTVDKSAAASIAAPGPLAYTVSVDNTGDVGLTHVTVSDPGYTVGSPAGDLDNDQVLDTNETWTYTFNRVVSQNDIDLGVDLTNTVSVSTSEAGSHTDSVSTKVVQNPHLTVTKTTNAASVDALGVITYTVAVTNDGNVTLAAPNVVDANAVLGTPTGDANGNTRLDVNETWTYTATHAVTQEELDRGDAIVNVASASASTVYTNKSASDDSDAVSTAIVQNPHLTVTKTADATSVDALGAITYTIAVTNDGNVTLAVPDVADANAVLGSPSGDDGNGLLDVNETWTYTATHAVTQDELDRGDAIVNVASASASTVYTNKSASDDSDAVSTAIVQNPHLTVTKTADATSVDALGVITYTVAVTNDGNVTLAAPNVVDANAVLGSPSGDDGNGLLDVNETWTYTATHAVTQDELDRGNAIVNVASASASTVYTARSASDDSDAVSTAVAQHPSIEVTKTLNHGQGAVHTTGNGPVLLVGARGGASAHTALTYDYTVVNTGNVTLTDVTLTDSVLGSVSLGAGPLAPLQSTAGSVSLEAANAAGVHGNTATADGTVKYHDTHVTDDDSASYVGAQGQVDIDKKISTDGGWHWSDGPVAAFQGLALNYQMTVANLSDAGLTLSDIAVTDSQATVTGVASTLAFGGSDASDVYTKVAGLGSSTNLAAVNATVLDAYGHSMVLTDTDSVSYTGVRAMGGHSEEYWEDDEHHDWNRRAASNVVLGDSNGDGLANDLYDLKIGRSAAMSLEHSSASGDARTILGGEFVAAQLNVYEMNSLAGAGANTGRGGLLDAAAKWFKLYGGQDDGTTNGSTPGSTNTGNTVSNSEWTNQRRIGFTFNEGSAVSTNGAAWKGDLFSFRYTSQVDHNEHVVGVTGEGLKNALAAFDHSLSGSSGHDDDHHESESRDGLVVSPDGSLVGWQKGSSVFFQYDNTATSFQGDHAFWSNVTGGAFIAVLNDAELTGKASLIGIHDNSGFNNT